MPFPSIAEAARISCPYPCLVMSPFPQLFPLTTRNPFFAVYWKRTLKSLRVKPDLHLPMVPEAIARIRLTREGVYPATLQFIVTP